MTFHLIDPFHTQVGQQIRFRPIQGEIPDSLQGVFKVVSNGGELHERGHRILDLNGRIVEYSPSQHRLGSINLPWGYKVEAKAEQPPV